MACDGNIDEAAEFNDHETGMFFMRVKFACSQPSQDILRAQFLEIAKPFDMRWQLHASNQSMPTVLFVSKEGHCLNDLLYRWHSGHLPIDIRAVISNHRDLEPLAAKYQVPFHYFAITPATKTVVESQQYELIESVSAQLVVLARYMQVLSDALCSQLSGRFINIHHSFLPGFKGARPYHQAHERGVKLIGATAHFVTAQLDEGPIIEQEVERVTHAHTANDLAEIGRDVERLVLARAVRLFAEDRIMLTGKRTVVFQ